MKPIKILLLLFISVVVQAQSDCRALSIKDSQNNSFANLSCDYPFDENGNIQLHAEFRDIKATTEYEVESMPFSPVADFQSGVLVSILEDDTFSDVISLPFTFCFYGEVHNEIVISDNGVISFDTSLANSDAPFYSSSLPNPSLYNGAIYGLFHDITNDDDVFGCTDDPTTGENECGEIRYDIVGEAPCRSFIINYSNLNHFNDEMSRSIFQVVLHESTNEIEVHIEEKPINNEPEGSANYRKYATIGIQCHEGIHYKSPEGRNNTIFETTQESWKFVPNGDSIVSFIWYNGQNEAIGTGETLSLSDKIAQNITLEALYEFCDSNTVIETAVFPIALDDSYPVVTSLNAQVCDEESDGSETIDLNDFASSMINNSNYEILYFASQEHAEIGINPISKIQSISLPSSYVFWVKLVADADCYALAPLQIQLREKPEVIQNQIDICDINNDGTESIILNDYINLISGGSPYIATSFYTSINNALNKQNPIEEITLNSPTTTLFVSLAIEGACSTVESIAFHLNDGPETPPQIEIEVCDNINIYNLLTIIPEEIFEQYSDIDFYTSENNAIQNTNKINNVSNYYLNGVAQLFIRVNSGVDCFSITQINFTYLEAIPTLQDIRVQCDSDENEVEIFDLSLSIPDMIESATDVAISYFTSLESAQGNIEAEKILNFNAYEIPISKTIVYVRFENTETGCVSINKIVLHAVAIPSPMQDEFSFCDPDEDESELIDLSEITNPIIGSQLFVENTYYLSEEDALSLTNPITQVEVAPEITIYVHMVIIFEGEELCSDIYPIDLNLILVPIEEIDLYVEICDNYNDGFELFDLSSFTSLIVQNSDLFDLSFYTSEGDYIENPYYYNISGDCIIQVRQRNNIACHSPVNLHITFVPSVNSHNILQYFCDPYPYDSEVLNLIEIVSENQPNLEGLEMTFYNTLQGVNNADPDDVIQNKTAFEVTQPIVIIYGSIQGEEGCPSIIQLALKLKRSPHALNSEVVICDTDNDGSEIFNPNDYNYYIFESNVYSISYFYTLEDAEANTNPVSELNLTDEITLFYNANYNAQVSCNEVGSVRFFLNSVPESQNFSLSICDNNNDNTETLDLTLYEENFISNPSLYDFSFYYSLDDAIHQMNAIADSSSAEIMGSSILFVVIENEAGCPSIANLAINLNQAPLVQNVVTGSCDEDFNLTEIFNLTELEMEFVENPSDFTIEYYMNYQAAIVSDAEYRIQNPGNYTSYNLMEMVYAKVTDPRTGCYSIANITLEIYKLPKLVDTEVEVCDADFNGFYELFLPEINASIIENVDAFTFQYFETLEEAQNQLNPLPVELIYTLNSIDDILYVMVTNANGCSAITSVRFYAGALTQNVLTEGILLENCDDDFDGITVYNLNEVRNYIENEANYDIEFYTSLEEAKIAQNVIENPSEFHNTSPSQFIYARIQEGDKCPTIQHFAIRVNRIPSNPFPEKYEKCPKETLLIDAGNEGISYVWNTGQTTRYIDVSEPGIYTVTITNDNGCESTYSVPVYNYALHSVTYNFTDQHTVVFSVTGESTYSFSLDNENFQSSNVFAGLTQGKYTLYVRDDETDCIVELPFLVFDWHNIITPNGDGRNDTWTECGLEVFGSENSALTVFDRYGKNIYSQASNSCFEWDGKYQGRALPSDTYWFTVVLPDGRKFNGYIAIKNYDNESVLR